MSLIILNVDEVRRTLSTSGGAFVVHDKEVDIVRFAINSGFADIVLDGQVALRVMYQRPGETEVRAQTLTYYDTDGLRNYYDWQLLSADLSEKGTLTVALCILRTDSEVEEWHTTPCQIRVLDTIHTDDSDEADETITPTVAQRVAVLETMIQRVASGAPIVVASTSAMTDTDQIYVLSTDRKWYYHNGATWVAGGEYGAVATDRTLTQPGMPADAKAVGDVINEVKADLINGVSIVPTWVDGARLYVRTGAVDTNNAYSYFKTSLLRHNGLLTITTYARTPASSVVFYDADDVYISDVWFLSTDDYLQTITVEIPANAATLGVSCVTAYKSVFSGYYNVDASEKLLYENVATNQNNIEKIDEELSNLQIIDTKTGENVSFVSIEGALLKQVVCPIFPVQAGTGTPSPNNVRNLTGINSLIIYHSQTDETVNTSYEYDFSATAGTVYVGELNVITGELTVTGALFTSSPSTASSWKDNPGRNGFYISLADMQITPNYGDAKCNWLQVDKNMRKPLSICVGYNSRVVFVNNITNNLSEVTSLADWLTYLESHPLQFTYPLATPVTYQLTGHDINALAGINKMWTDSMNITVSYVIGTEDYIKNLNGWNGKKYAAIGDSITWGFTPKNTEGHRSQLKSYAALTAENLDMTFENYGIAGCTFAVLAGHETDLYPIATRWQNLPDDADLITVTGGTNDVRLGVPLGTIADRGTDTYYGAWHTVLGGLYKKYFIDQGADVGKTKKIVVITPIKLLQTPASTQGGNGTLREWESWINAIKEVAAYYSFPVLDFYNLSNINPELNGTVYDSDVGYQGYYNMYITDGVHPTQEGAEIMANVLTGFLKTLL